MDLTLVIVNYNTTERVAQLLRTVADATPGLRAETIIVDNATRGFDERGWAGSAPYRLIRNQENRGFAAACNQAMREARGRHLVLVNPDLLLRPGSLTMLSRYLDEHPEVGAVGPQLLHGDGSIQHSCRRLPTLGGILSESLGLARLFPRSRVFGAYRMTDWDHQDEREVDQLMGACLMAPAALLRELHYFDERFFMYFEEVDLCRRIRAAGRRLMFLPRAQAVHYRGESALTDKSNALIGFYRSRGLYFAKHHGPLAAACVQVISRVDVLLRALVWRLRSWARRGDLKARLLADSYAKTAWARWRPAGDRRR